MVLIFLITHTHAYILGLRTTTVEAPSKDQTHYNKVLQE